MVREADWNIGVEAYVLGIHLAICGVLKELPEISFDFETFVRELTYERAEFTIEKNSHCRGISLPLTKTSWPVSNLYDSGKK